MSLTAINIAALLLIILPGFLAYRFAVWRRVDPARRSALWQLSEILEHSVYVHLIGIALAAAFCLVLNRVFGLDAHFQELFQVGPEKFLQTRFQEAVLMIALYSAYVIASSAIIGAYDVPSKISSLIVSIPRRIRGSAKFLNWMPVPKETHPHEPVWRHAFHSMADARNASIPYVMVALKSGDVYFGEISSYPITLDTENEKDFLIIGARYYKNGDLAQGQNLDSFDGVGAVLLNTANVDSIRIYYHKEEG